MKYKIGDLIKNNVEKRSYFIRNINYETIDKKLIIVPKNSIVMYMSHIHGLSKRRTYII